MREMRGSARVYVAGGGTGGVTVLQPLTILDLSESGAQVETTFPLPLEALHDFRLPLGSRSVVVKGRIVHCGIRELRDAAVKYRSGVQFVQPSAHARRVIAAFVEARRALRRAHAILDAEIADDGV